MTHASGGFLWEKPAQALPTKLFSACSLSRRQQERTAVHYRKKTGTIPHHYPIVEQKTSLQPQAPRMSSSPAADPPRPPASFVHALMLLAAALVSTSFTVGAAIAHDLDPQLLTLLRFTLAAFLFAPLAGRRRPLRLPSPARLAGYATIAFCLTGFFWLMFLALRFTTALNTSAIYTTVPGLSGLYGALLLGERLGRSRLIALFLGMTGALWVIFRGDIHRLLALEYNQGDVIFFAGCLLMALYTPLVKKFHRGEPMEVMTFWILATGVAWLLCFSLPQLAAFDPSAVPLRAWLGVAYLAVFTTMITFFLSQWATLHLGPTRVMAYSYLYPGLVIVIDWLCGHGLPPTTVWPGVGIVLVATVVLQRGEVLFRDSAGP